MIRFSMGSGLLACGGLALAATAAVAGSGVGGVFNLGETNSVDARTYLAGSTTSQQLYVTNNSTSGGAIGVLAASRGSIGLQGQSPRIGVRAVATGTTGVNQGVYATTASVDGFAGFFQNTGTTSNPQLGRGVRALAAGSSATLFNRNDGAGGGEFAGPNGVIGVASDPRGAGVVGRSASADGYAGYFQNSSTAATGTALQAISGGATGSEFLVGGYGGAGKFAGPNGLVAAASVPGGAGVVGLADTVGGIGVFGRVTAKEGFAGVFQNTSRTTDPREGAGIRALAAGAASSLIDDNVFSAGGGEFAGPNGVVGLSSKSDGGAGVAGYAGDGTYGVYGQATAAGDFAVYANGNAHVTGRMTKNAGAFKIDHPLDPAYKYLLHSFVESPDMMNIYNGNVITDAEGVAEVALPDYFEALNRDPRYQLTVIGSFADAQIARKVEGNRFVIRTSEPDVEVSWQVTGIRQDAYAKADPIVVEEEKALADRGRYLNPEAHGMPAELAIGRMQAPRQQALARPASTQGLLKSD